MTVFLNKQDVVTQHHVIG